GSDLDVLLLHSARQGIATLADRIWYPIWDSGTRLDHAVRRPADARRVARRDVRVALGLLHARHVAGDPTLTSELRLGALADWRRCRRCMRTGPRGPVNSPSCSNPTSRRPGAACGTPRRSTRPRPPGPRRDQGPGPGPRTRRSWTPGTRCTR